MIICYLQASLMLKHLELLQDVVINRRQSLWLVSAQSDIIKNWY